MDRYQGTHGYEASFPACDWSVVTNHLLSSVETDFILLTDGTRQFEDIEANIN